jgi:hypothetical protein
MRRAGEVPSLLREELSQRRTVKPSSTDETKCDFPRLLRIVPGDTLMRLRPKWRDEARCRGAPQVCGQQKIVRPAANRAKYDGRFPERWW